MNSQRRVHQIQNPLDSEKDPLQIDAMPTSNRLVCAALLLVNSLLAPPALASSRLFDLHAEGESWQIDEFRAPELLQGERYPTRISKRTFDSEQEARAALDRLNGDHVSVGHAGLAESTTTLNPEHWGQNLKRLTPASARGIWKAQASWNSEWELRFAQWVQAEVQADFFKTWNLSIDCADVVYSLRFIFSRINGLKFGVRLAGSQVVFTHAAVDRRWSRFPTHPDWHQDLRFRAALDFLLDNTYTSSLIADSYPIRISAETVTAGTHFLDFTTYQNAAHTWIVFRAHPNGQDIPLEMACASEPKQPWILMRVPFLDSATEMPQKRGGFMRLRWLNSSESGLVPAARMPDFSLEQFDPAFIREKGTLGLSTQFRVNPTPQVSLLFRQHLEAIRAAFSMRNNLVDIGYAVCSAQPRKCAPGMRDYEDYSTPSRDRRILENIKTARALIEQFGPPLAQIWEDLLPASTLRIETRFLTFRDLVEIWESGSYTSDPRDPPVKRWGM